MYPQGNRVGLYLGNLSQVSCKSSRCDFASCAGYRLVIGRGEIFYGAQRCHQLMDRAMMAGGPTGREN